MQTKNRINFDPCSENSRSESRLLHLFGFVPAAGRISLCCPPKFQRRQDVLNALFEFKRSVYICVNPWLKMVLNAFSFVTSCLGVRPVFNSFSSLSSYLAILLFSYLALSLPAFSALVFDQPTIEIPPNPSLTEWVADYPFKNTGNKTVTIKDIRTCCECTAAKVEKKTFAPDESGKVSLLFKTEGKSGIQQKHAVITTDDGAQPSVIYLKGMIPTIWDYVTVSSQTLRWEKGEKRIVKKIVIKILQGSNLQVTNAVINNNEFQIKRNDSISGVVEYEILPPSRKNKSAILNLQTDFSSPFNKSIEINLGAY